MRTTIFAVTALSLTACFATEPPVPAPEPMRTIATEPVHEVLLPETSEELTSEEPILMVESIVVEPTGPPAMHFTLRRGETLAHFARWSEIPVEDIAQSSELDLEGDYAVGTEISLVLSPDERSMVEMRRDTHHQVRAENYLASRGAAGTDFYTVKSGDSAWTIARDREGMPVWLLESLNPSVDLDRLRPGDSLLVPVFNDIVAEAPSEPSPEDTD